MSEGGHGKIRITVPFAVWWYRRTRRGYPHVRIPFDILRVLKNPAGTPAVPKMHDRNDACADHAWIKGLGHSLVRMSKMHVYPRYYRRHRSDEIGIGGVGQCRRECTEVGPPQLEKMMRPRSGLTSLFDR
jgi:hypothetical protein